MDLSASHNSSKLKEKSISQFGLSKLSPERNSCGRKSKEILVVVNKQSKSKEKAENRAKSLSSSQLRQMKSKSKYKKHQIRNKTLDSLNSKSLKNLKKQHIEQFTKKVRKTNKKFLPRQNSSQNLQMRLPWGVDEPRLNNYVLQTLAKMQKMRRAQYQRREDTFQTEKSQLLKDSDIKLQLTPKKTAQSKPKPKINDKVIKSPAYQDERTSKKTLQSKKSSTQEQKTQKNRKTEQNQHQSPKNKQHKVSELISKCLNGQFLCIQKNNFYSINFRIVDKKIIEIDIAFAKKAQSVTITLNKGSLQCQSIQEVYKDVQPKSSIILMTAISGILDHEKFIYPELQLMLNQKQGNFGLQKRVVLPYNWLNLLEPLSPSQLKTTKLPSKIKNKSVLDQIPYRKDLLLKMQKIFSNNFIKYKIKQNLFYLYGFRLWGELTLMRIVISGTKCLIQCENASTSNTGTRSVLEMFQAVLDI